MQLRCVTFKIRTVLLKDCIKPCIIHINNNGRKKMRKNCGAAMRLSVHYSFAFYV